MDGLEPDLQSEEPVRSHVLLELEGEFLQLLEGDEELRSVLRNGSVTSLPLRLTPPLHDVNEM